MMIFKKAIPRRTFLRGAGVALALPLLDGMVPAFAAGSDAAAKPASRLMFLYGPNGRIMDKWTPASEGAAFEMTPTLKPLAAFRDQLLVLSGLNVKAADPVGNEPGGNHARPCAAFLTGIHPKPGGAVGISVDQFAAKEFGKQTQLGSLELAMESPEGLGAADGAYSDSYTKTISWRTGTTPLPMENNPRKIFERLLGDTGSTDSTARLRGMQKSRSILDFVSQAVDRLSLEIGPSDRNKLTEYLDAVRDIERRIQLAEDQASRELPSMQQPAGIPTLYSEHAKLMFDLQLLAFQGDLTRITTFMWGRESGEPNYQELGLKDGHHSLSHHSGNPEMIAACEKIDAFHSSLFAYFLDKLRSAPEGDGTLLDHSFIVYSNGLSDGMAHTHHDVPTLLAGGGMGKIKGGRHIRYQGLPLSNLYLAVLDMVGMSSDGYLDPKYSDGSGPLEGLSG